MALTPVSWPRSFPPLRSTWQEGKSPLISSSQNNRKMVRDSIQVGVSWRETYPPTFARSAEAQDLMFQARIWHREGRPILVAPFHKRRTQSGPAAGSTGAVAGGSQTGESLVTDGWSASGTVKKGDYVVVAGFPYALWLTEDAAIAGGSATFQVSPAIYLGTTPADNATVTLNGDLEVRLHEPPRMPATISPGPEYFGGLELMFEERVESLLQTSLTP